MAEKKPEKKEEKPKEEVKEETLKKEEPKAEKSKAAPKKKKKKLLEKAKETLEEARGKPEPVQTYKDTRVKDTPRVYTVPLNTKHTRNAISSLKDFVKKHVKAEEVAIDQKLNLELWAHGRKKPPRKVKVKVSQDETGRALIEAK